MGWSGSGTFNRLYSWVADKAAGLDISSSRMDADTDDIASGGFGNCLTRDGQGQPTANLPMAGFRHTGVGNGQAQSDYSALGQAQNGLLNWTTAGGAADALTATLTPAIGALTDGLLVHARAASTNITTTPTFNLNGIGAETIVGNFRSIVAGDIVAGAELILRWNNGNSNWVLVNQPIVPVGGSVPYYGGSIPTGFALPQGQNLSAATYPAANAILGTTYGNPGGGNFTMPDLRGRVLANLDAGGSGRITSAGGNFDGTTLGNAGGAQNKSITIAQDNLPSVNFSVSVTDGGHSHNLWGATGGTNTVEYLNNSGTLGVAGNIAGNSQQYYTSTQGGSGNAFVSSSTTGITATAASGGSGTALMPAIVQPTMVINVMMRIA